MFTNSFDIDIISTFSPKKHKIWHTAPTTHHAASAIRHAADTSLDPHVINYVSSLSTAN
jgi:hypothetical protein